ncbi:MAG: ERAP1-like C-terminal domain-containing protein, partial [Candidatus Rokubacteria bacterium]|nr:ERAP1-like C-terminal domain-containing protein [Candidatus Rokubacteria bacterium]
MITVTALGWKAHAALTRAGGTARALAALSSSRYLRAADEIVWLGPRDSVLHGRAILTGDVSPASATITFALDGLTPWRPRPLECAEPSTLAGAGVTLVRALIATETPRGFGALLAGRAPDFPLAGAADAAARLARASAGDDAHAAERAALPLLGLGPGLTPAGDDFVGGVFFGRRLAGAGAAWREAAALVRAVAAARTHPISAALLGDLLDGEGWAPLHELATAVTAGADADALAAARRLIRLGHSSGWDILAGFLAGTGALAGIRTSHVDEVQYASRRQRGLGGCVARTPNFKWRTPVDPYRLPRHVVPLRYDLKLAPDLVRATFTGEETVTITVSEPTRDIVLNTVELIVTEAAVGGDGGEQGALRITHDAEAERVTLSFAASVMPGTWRLRLAFSGTLNDKLRGFYRSTYKDPSGKTCTLAATQFEATDARRAFPCWDEPAFKAIFATTLVIDPALTAVSNTRITAERNEDARKVVTFADTIKMSTYLVAFVVGDLEATEAVAVGRTPLRVWCVPGKRRLAAFGQRIAAASLAFFERYYGLPYPGDKLDLLAIPDFAAGAMENLGAITFRETALLVDEAAATHAELERVADVVAHENAHMWFGDLVTMTWWNGIWLNEAFATFMEMLAVDDWKPDWRRWTTFGVSRAAAFAVDGLWATRPIEFPVRAPREADAMFDVLTYEKGASVLRMLEQYLGPEVFRAGVREYLRAHTHENADTGDLWAALGHAASQPIPEIMDGWIFRPGYPLVSARRDGDTLVLTQQRFTYLREAPGASAAQYPGEASEGPPLRSTTAGGADQRTSPWRVPVQIRIGDGPQARVERVLLDGAEARVPLGGAAPALVNEGGHGFYRVRYTPDLLEPLLARVPRGLEPIERFNLVGDAWAGVLAGLVPVTQYLDLATRFGADRDRNVWTMLIGSLHSLTRAVAAADRPRLAAYARVLLGPAVAELGWEPRPGEDELTRQLRGDLLRALGVLGDDAATQARAAGEYARAQKDPGTVDPNVLPALIAILAWAGDAARYEEFLHRFRAAS